MIQKKNSSTACSARFLGNHRDTGKGSVKKPEMCSRHCNNSDARTVIPTIEEAIFNGNEKVNDMIKILLITIILVGIAFAGMGIRLLLDRKAEFSGGSCQSGSKALEDKGITCGCGGGHCANDQEA